jgi:hypothetical protein
MFGMVRKTGLEPVWNYPLAPQASASANFATSACYAAYTCNEAGSAPSSCKYTRAKPSESPEGMRRLEVQSEFAEAAEMEQSATFVCGADGLLFEDPCAGMGQVDGMHAGCESRVHVAAWTVADHPC